MKKQGRKISSGIFSLIVLMIAGSTGSSIYAQTTSLTQTFQFGPETNNPSNSTIFLMVPALTHILNTNIVVQRNPMGRNGQPVAADTPVTAELIGPGPQIGPLAQQSAVAGVDPSFTTIVNIPGPGFFTSSRGCPNRWRIRIRTQNGLNPSARVFGTVTVYLATPPAFELEMAGGPLTLLPLLPVTRTLGAEGPQGPDPALIAGTGTFSIRAGWTGQNFSQVRVQLLRPNGSVAAERSSTAARMNLAYTANAADAAMPGPWRIRARSLMGPVTNFDIEGASFNSTFQAVCAGGVSLTGN